MFLGRRVLITGATGFLGLHVTHTLASLGAEVTGLSRSASADNLPAGVTPVACDVRHADAIDAVVTRFRPDIILHLAAEVTADRSLDLVQPMFETNARGTVNVLSAGAKANRPRVVLVGSSECPRDLSEAPNSPYAASKIVAEQYGLLYQRLYDVPVVRVRPFLIYGPGQRTEKLIPYSIVNFLEGRAPRIASGNRVCDVVYVEDVVNGLLRIAVAPDSIAGQRLDLGSGVGISVREIVETVARTIDAAVRPTFAPVPDRPYEETEIADITRTTALVGWTPRWTLEHGLRRTTQWYREHAVARLNQ